MKSGCSFWILVIILNEVLVTWSIIIGLFLGNLNRISNRDEKCKRREVLKYMKNGKVSLVCNLDCFWKNIDHQLDVLLRPILVKTLATFVAALVNILS